MRWAMMPLVPTQVAMSLYALWTSALQATYVLPVRRAPQIRQVTMHLVRILTAP